MAMSDIKSYMQQWLQTASKGNISVDYAWFQDRMELRCKACNAIFRCSLPSNPTEIDWSVQDWVTKHVPGGVHDMKVLHTPVDPIPMTADFQKLPGLHPLPTVDASEKKAAILSKSKLISPRKLSGCRRRRRKRLRSRRHRTRRYRTRTCST